MIDVGGLYEHATLRYDHHQRGFFGARPPAARRWAGAAGSPLRSTWSSSNAWKSGGQTPKPRRFRGWLLAPRPQIASSPRKAALVRDPSPLHHRRMIAVIHAFFIEAGAVEGDGITVPDTPALAIAA